MKTNYSIDVLDGLGANIDVQTRGSDVLRILPRVNEEVNEEWISDKSRHAFYGLKKQRLTIPMERAKDGQFKELKWEEALSLAKEKLQTVSPEKIHGRVGQFVDVETIVAFKDLLNRINCENIDVRKDAPDFDCDFRQQYLFNSKIVGLDDCDLLLLVGVNPKTENPVINARIRKSKIVNGLEIAVIGSALNLNYEYTHLGTTPEELEQLANGSHPYLARLQSAELPMLVVGSEVFARSDSDAIKEHIKELAKNTNLINKQEQWNGVNVLHRD